MEKIILILIFFYIININAQSEKEDYILLNLVIKEYVKPSKLDTIKLKRNSRFIYYNLSSYYTYKYVNKNIIKIIGVKYDKNNKRIPDYYTEEIQEKFRSDWLSRYDTLSKILTKKDFNELLKLKNKPWDENKVEIKIFTLKGVVRKDVSIFRNAISISRPYYSLNGKYVIIQLTGYKKAFIYVYRKEDGNWVLNNIIK